MSEATRLLEEATPLPWERADSAEIYDVALIDEVEDARLIVYAVNRLPDYEAAVRALRSLVDALEYEPGSMLGGKIALGYEALARLRESEAVDVR